MIHWSRLTAAGLVLLGAFCARADVALPAVLADHMVVQRGLPVHIWGKAAAGESIAATFRGDTRTTVADELGLWSLYLPPAEAGGPFELTLKGDNTVSLRDVLVGDVWVASGQSNMEFPLKQAVNGPAEVTAAKFPQIRLFHVKQKSAYYPMDDLDAKSWTACNPETVSDFSAVAYFFGRHLNEKLGVPIGLIESDWGGSPADAWTSLRALSADASLMPVFVEWSRMMDGFANTRMRREKQFKEWQQAVAHAKAEGKPAPSLPWEPNRENEWMPAGLYNGMIAPLTRFPIRGAIWYQGESNASVERAPLYSHLFQTMIQDWRHAWGVGDFPFLFVQIANFETELKWPEVREAQLRTLTLAKTGMAVTTDIGDPKDIHPKNKRDVGLRLALAARAIAYGESVEYSGPLFRGATPEGNSMRVWFDHTGSSLSAKGGTLKGFEVAGRDRKFVVADARIDGATVVVSAPSINSPAYVRFGWSVTPDCNLYNAEGLPASPFRSGE